ncbi:MAG: head GIN domain-containing protein [Flavicella sp.]
MNKYFVILFLSFSLTLTAQEKITVNLDPITELKVFSGLKVNLIQSKSQKLVITGSKAAAVSVKSKKGKLKLSMDLSSTFSSKDVTIDLYFNSPIAELDANQGAVISSKNTIKQPQLKLSSQGGSYIKMPVATDLLNVKALTGAHIKLWGSSKTQTVSIMSGASYESFELSTDQATVHVSTGGNAKVTATSNLDAKVKLGGSIIYGGSPKSVITEKVLGGSIDKL